jgi:hypothetical protein
LYSSLTALSLTLFVLGFLGVELSKMLRDWSDALGRYVVKKQDEFGLRSF